MPYTPKTYTTQVTAEDLSRAETGIQTAQAGVDLAAPQSALDVVESGAAASAAAIGVIKEAYPTLDSLGAVGDGTTDDTAALAAAAATGIVHQLSPGRRYVTASPIQLARGGGFVGHNKFEMEALTDPQLTVASEIVNFQAGQHIFVMPVGATGDYDQVAAVKLDGMRLLATGAGACISVPNGGRGVDIGDLVLYPGVGGKGVHHKGFIQDWRVKHLRCYGGKYGWYSDNESAAANGDECRIDVCDLRLFISGATKYAVLLRVGISDQLTLRPRIVSAAEHGIVLAGGFASLIVESANFEANGFAQFGLGITPTTGAISAGAAALTVASVTGFAVGQTICVRGAGAIEAYSGAQDLVTTIVSITGSVLTLAAAATTTVAAADVTRALYSDFHAGADLGSPEGVGAALGGGAGNVTFVSPGWGLSTYLRYAADLSGISNPVIVNPKQGGRPVYDPGYRVLHDPAWEPALDGAGYAPPHKWQLLDDSAAGGVNRMGTGWTAAAGQGFAVRRIGRRVLFRGYASASASAAGTVCTLPPGCRPSRNVVFFATRDSANMPSAGIIAPTGVVTSYVGTTAAGATCFDDGFAFSVD